MKKKIDSGVIIMIVMLIIFIAGLSAILYACDYISENSGGSSSSSDVCGICGGDGVVTFKSLGEGTGVQEGFDTYYRCKGCHGTGKKAY